MFNVTERAPRQVEVKPRADEVPESFPPGRRCAEQGCITVLCQWNPGPWCYCHAARHERELAEALGEAEARREMAAA